MGTSPWLGPSEKSSAPRDRRWASRRPRLWDRTRPSSFSASLLDPLAPFADFIGETLAVLGDVFEDDLVEQHGHGVEVAGEGVGTHAQGFERDGAAAGKRVHDKRPGAGRAAERFVRGLGESAAGVEVVGDGGVVPVGEVGDEVEQRAAQTVVVVEAASELLSSLDEPLETLGPLRSSAAGRPPTQAHELSCRLPERRADRAGPPGRARGPRR